MLKTRVIPALLLKDRGLVKTVKFKDPAYVGDPVNVIRIFNEKEVPELILLDIGATRRSRRPQLEIIKQVASECFMPLAYGGGVRDLEDLRAIFNLGVEKVALNTRAVEDPSLLTRAAEVFGSQSLVAALDVKKSLFGRYEVHTHGGGRNTKQDPVETARALERAGAGEILLTSMDRDGTMSGYDLELIRRVAEAVRVPVIACGGAGRVEDFGAAVCQGGASAVAAGSMVVFQGKARGVLINYPSRERLKKELS